MLELCENVCLISTEHSPQLMRKTKQAKSKSERNSKISHYFRFLLQFAKSQPFNPQIQLPKGHQCLDSQIILRKI